MNFHNYQNIKLSFTEGYRLAEMEHGDVFFIYRHYILVPFFPEPLQQRRLLGEATHSVVSFSIRRALVISHPDCEVFTFFSLSAVGAQDISLVDNGTSAVKLILQVQSPVGLERECS